MKRGTSVCGRKPTAKPIATIMATTKRLRARSASVRPARTAERDIGRERNRSRKPVLQVGRKADGGADGAEDGGLDEYAGHQVVDVAYVGDLDGAAEDVAKQEHEDHRLDRREDGQLGHASVGEEVAAGHGQDVGGGAGELLDAVTLDGLRRREGGNCHFESLLSAGSRLVSSLCWLPSPSPSARLPVSSRNTSSRLGSRTAMVVGATAGVIELAEGVDEDVRGLPTPLSRNMLRSRSAP